VNEILEVKINFKTYCLDVYNDDA